MRLKQFKIVVEAGGLLKASEFLGISGGGLSKSIKTLEVELGHKLFIQKGRGLELTEAGQHLYERVPEILKTFDNLIDLKTVSHKSALRLVSFEVFTTYFLSNVVAKSFRGRTIEIREAIPGQMESLISQGHSDIGITYLPIPQAGVEFVKVGKIRMGIYGLKGARKGLAIKEMPFVIPISPLQGTPSGVRGLDGWPEHLFERAVLYRVEMMETAIQLCQKGIAVSFLPEFIVQSVNHVSISEFHLSELTLPTEIKPVYRDVFLIHRKSAEETKVIKVVAKAIRNLA